MEADREGYKLLIYEQHSCHWALSTQADPATWKTLWFRLWHDRYPHKLPRCQDTRNVLRSRFIIIYKKCTCSNSYIPSYRQSDQKSACE